MEKDILGPLAEADDLDSLWNPEDIASSEAAYRERLAGTDTHPVPDRSRSIELLSLIARSQALQGRTQEAGVTLKEALARIEESQAPVESAARIRWLIEKGRLQILDKTPSQARLHFSQAWTLAVNSNEDFFVVEIAQLMATVETAKSQQEWIDRAIEIAEASPHPKTRAWLGGLYMSLGRKLYDLRLFEKSLETFERALQAFQAQGADRDAFVARWSGGKTLRALGKTQEALAVQRGLLSELGIGGRRDGRLYEEVAECLQALEQAAEARLYFELAYRELSSDGWVRDNQPLKLKRMKELGKVK